MEELIKLFEKLKKLSAMTDIFANFSDKFSGSLIDSKLYKNFSNIKLPYGGLYKNAQFLNPFYYPFKNFYANNDTLGNIFPKVFEAVIRLNSKYINMISDKKFDNYKFGSFPYNLSQVVLNSNSFNKKIEEQEKSFSKGFIPFEIINNVHKETVNNPDMLYQKTVADIADTLGGADTFGGADIVYNGEKSEIINTAYEKGYNTRLFGENISDDVFDEFGVKLASALKNALSNKDRTIGY